MSKRTKWGRGHTSGPLQKTVAGRAVGRSRGSNGPAPWDGGNSYTKGNKVLRDMEDGRRPRRIKPTKRTGG